MRKLNLLNIGAWTWTILAGGGGLIVLIMRGPWPLTNGWFALCSGVSMCPLVPRFFKKYIGITVSPATQLLLAILFFVAGRIALLIEAI